MRTSTAHLSGLRSNHPRPTILQRLVAAVATWRRRARERHMLASLDATTRRDLGLSDAEIWLEAAKAPWRA
jgi:uncharacterized protein YjiS (DUF1127 family)